MVVLVHYVDYVVHYVDYEAVRRVQHVVLRVQHEVQVVVHDSRNDVHDDVHRDVRGGPTLLFNFLLYIYIALAVLRELLSKAIVRKMCFIELLVYLFVALCNLIFVVLGTMTYLRIKRRLMAYTKLEEAMQHAQKGYPVLAVALFKEVYTAAMLEEDHRTCLRALNCYCYTVTGRSQRCCSAQLALCQKVGKSDPMACVVGYTSIGLYFLLVLHENAEAIRVLDLAESFLPTPRHLYGRQLKRILEGKVHAYYRQSIANDDGGLQSLQQLMRLWQECHLNRSEQAHWHHVHSEVLFLCRSRSEAAEAREAMYKCLGRCFEPTCPICLEEDMVLDSPETLILTCFHAAHRTCFMKGGLVACPLCRAACYAL